MKVKKLTPMTLPVLILGALLFLALPKVFAGPPHTTFTLTAPGVGLEDSTLLIAARLNNTSQKSAINVKIDSVQLDSALLLTPTPVPVGEINAGQSAIVQANFDSSQLTPGKQYQLIMRGSYESVPKDKDDKGKGGKKDHKSKGKYNQFLVESVIVLPPAAPGSAPLGTVNISSSVVTGAPYRHQPPAFGDDDEVNPQNWTVPTASFEAGTISEGTSVQPAPSGSAVSSSSPQSIQNASPLVVFNANNSLGITSGVSTIAEPSGGVSGGGVVFATMNWMAAFSTDGINFTPLDPTTIFPADAIGFCCDQIVQYIPSIDRFVWLLQGSSGYRLAAASPEQVVASGGKDWTYWNLPPNLFGSCTSLDYPDLSLGNSFLNISWDAGASFSGECSGGFQVARTSFAGLQAGGTITLQFTDPVNAPMAWGSHLMQDTGDEVFWAGHNNNKNMRIFSLPENSDTYSWRDRGISSWANNAPNSTTPDGQDWLGKNFSGATGNGAFPGNGVIGATRVGNRLWFAWSAGTDSNFPQAHIELVTFDRSEDFSKGQQMQVWNPDYAFAYPALSTNACTFEVGMSFEFGGGGNYENHVVGFWGDFVAYVTTASNVGTNRFGDYVTIRRAPPTGEDPGNLFAAFGYGLNSVPAPGTGVQADVHYVLFGRPASSCVVVE